MEYWKGVMNWPIDPNWECETCGRSPNIIMGGLTWGFVNGVCRCNHCHTEYSMRDGDTILTTPVSRLKPEYKEPMKLGYAKYKLPIAELTDEMLDEFMVA